MKKIKILHITPHMGGGAGKAISGLAISDNNTHEIIILTNPDKLDYIYECKKHNIPISICPKEDTIINMIKDADIIIINWWHHPSIYPILLLISKIPTRVIIWCHVNGLFYPYIKPDFLKCFDGCMFTSKSSFDNTNWSIEEKTIIYENAILLLGMGNFKPNTIDNKTSYAITDCCSIGFVGTLDYSKLHPDTIQWIAQAISRQKNLRFTFIGDIHPDILNDAKKAHLLPFINFAGYKSNIPELLKQFDIFFYPLNPTNYATTENSLIEAMAAGLPIIASDGIVEKSIIDDELTGILASNAKDFSVKLQKLINNEELRKSLGINAKNHARSFYDVASNNSRFVNLTEKLIKYDKKAHALDLIIGNSPFEWFLNGCNRHDANIIQQAS